MLAPREQRFSETTYLQNLGVERMEWPASSPDLTHWKFVRSASVCCLYQSDQHNHVSCCFKNGMPSHTALDRASGTVISALSVLQNAGELMEPESPPGQLGTGFGGFEHPQEWRMACYHLKKASLQVNSPPLLSPNHSQTLKFCGRVVALSWLRLQLP